MSYKSYLLINLIFSYSYSYYLCIFYVIKFRNNIKNRYKRLILYLFPRIYYLLLSYGVFELIITLLYILNILLVSEFNIIRINTIRINYLPLEIVKPL